MKNLFSLILVFSFVSCYSLNDAWRDDAEEIISYCEKVSEETAEALNRKSPSAHTECLIRATEVERKVDYEFWYWVGVTVPYVLLFFTGIGVGLAGL